MKERHFYQSNQACMESVCAMTCICQHDSRVVYTCCKKSFKDNGHRHLQAQKKTHILYFGLRKTVNITRLRRQSHSQSPKMTTTQQQPRYKEVYSSHFRVCHCTFRNVLQALKLTTNKIMPYRSKELCSGHILYMYFCLLLFRGCEDVIQCLSEVEPQEKSNTSEVKNSLNTAYTDTENDH